jgi:hypothetical protein
MYFAEIQILYVKYSGKLFVTKRVTEGDPARHLFASEKRHPTVLCLAQNIDGFIL